MKFSEVNLCFSTVNNVKILNQSCRILCSCVIKLVLVGASVILGVGKVVTAADLKTSCFHNLSFYDPTVFSYLL